MKAAPLPAPSGSIRYTPLGAAGLPCLIVRQLTAPAHEPALQAGPAGHATPQPPQLSASVCRLLHPLSGLPSQSPKPELQVDSQVPAVQVGAAPGRVGHTTPHAPQLLALVVFASHPLASSWEFPRRSRQCSRDRVLRVRGDLETGADPRQGGCRVGFPIPPTTLRRGLERLVTAATAIAALESTGPPKETRKTRAN